jgi:DNA-3-methyladenine glycosylase I
MQQRCEWAADPRLREYHDLEWGVPLHDDRRLFELLVLEGAQAGLSWSTILRKRATYRAAFHDFDVEQIAGFGSSDVERLMNDPGIVRHRQKILSAIQNARAVATVVNECGSLDSCLWSFVEGAPVQNAWRSLSEVPARTATSDAMSKALRKRGFSFVGSTICYAFMQAVGMVNDHTIACRRFGELGGRS